MYFKANYNQRALIKKSLLIMKITTILLFSACLTASAGGIAQKVNLSQKNVKLEKVFREIRKQTGYVFFYDAHVLQGVKPVDIQIKNASVEEALNQTLQGQSLDFSIERKTITLFKKAGYTLVTTPIVGDLVPLPVLFNEIDGTVKDAQGHPLAGVSVIVKGTTKGTSTGTDGSFNIDANVGDVLEFSIIGYQSKSVKLVSNAKVNIKMEVEETSGGEIVVVGYGSQKKSDLTGAISSVKGDDLTQLSTQRVDQALQGRASGVMVLNTDGAPGGKTTIRVRGMNSVLGGNNALVVIDGLQGGDLSTLNPNDIESIEILKDASATAIYGAQGANGVILVTTKLGKIGKPVISYDFFYGKQKIEKTLPTMSASDFARTVNAYKQLQNSNGTTPPPLFSDGQIAKFEAKGFGTNWQNLIYRIAPLQNHDLSISGGTEKTKYFASAGYLDQTGIMLNSFYKRFSLRTNLQTDLNKWSSFGLNFSATKEQGNAPSYGSNGDVSFFEKPSNAAPRWDAIQPVYDSNGTYHQHDAGYGASDVWNPLASTVEPKIDNNTLTNNLNANIEFKPLPGLSIKITGGGSIGEIDNQSFYNSKTLTGLSYNGMALIVQMQWRYFQNSNILTYDRVFGNHHFTFTGVEEQSSSYNTYKNESYYDFATEATGFNNLGGANRAVVTNNNSERKLQSYLGRLNYIYDNKYLFTASIRGDGSSVFGANNKWGYFPSFAVAWKASQEEFIKNIDVISNLKFRYSWGITGNQGVQPYQSFATIGSGANYPYNGTDRVDLGYYLASPANPNLKWEATTQNDYGIDLGLFQNRLVITADYYDKTTDNLLMYRPLPNYTGYSNLLDNVGSMHNSGYELSISGDIIKGKINWNSAFTLSGNKNKVLDLGDKERIPFYTSNGGYGVGDVNAPLMYLIKGKSFGEMIGYKYLGTWKESEKDEAFKYGELPGDEKWFDKNGDGEINLDDITVIGNAMPKYIFGWSNNISYKNFDLSILVQGTVGTDLFNMPRIRLEQPGEGTSIALLNRWTPENQNTDVPAFTDDLTYQAAGLTSHVNRGYDNRVSRWVEDASYARIKNITIGYTLPAKIMERIKLKSLRFYVSGTNLYTWTKYKGYTPEVSAYNDNDAAMGVDFSSYPQSRIINFGLNLSF